MDSTRSWTSSETWSIRISRMARSFPPRPHLRPTIRACSNGGVIRRCDETDREAIFAIVNAAAEAYRDVIPPDRWHEPYMPMDELVGELDAGVVFWGYEDQGELVGIMGIQPVRDVELIRHAYVSPARQSRGVGGALLDHLVAA